MNVPGFNKNTGPNIILAIAISAAMMPISAPMIPTTLPPDTTAVISGPKYATAESRRIIERMIEAHGGYATWKNAPTIAYDNTFFNPFAQSDENPWWFTRETIDQKTRRVFQDWEIDKSVLVFDGQETWTTNWRGGNPPRFMVHFFYYFVNLPWLTQDDNVLLGDVGHASLPGFDESFYTITMSFSEDPAEGKVAADTYKLYIHPETYRLQGYEYSIGYGAMLDLFGLPDGELFGPMLRVHDSFTEVDGLIFPARMFTMAPDGSQTCRPFSLMSHPECSRALKSDSNKEMLST